MSNQRENPSDFKTRCKRDERYCRENIEDRTSRDNIARQVWYEKFYFLKNNAWWTFRNLQHWIRDYEVRSNMDIFDRAVFEPFHPEHKGGGGCRRDCSSSERRRRSENIREVDP